MSRGPLEVLMDSCRLISIGGLAKEAAELRKAIAQVEALVEAAEIVACNQEATYSYEFDSLDAALAPFTPGQDSGGGVSDA